MLKFKELVQQGDCTVLFVFAVFCSGGRFGMPPPGSPGGPAHRCSLGEMGGWWEEQEPPGLGAGVLVARGALGTPAQLLRPPRLRDRDRDTVSGTELLILS